RAKPEEQQVHEDVARIRPRHRQRPPLHPPDPDRVHREEDAEQGSQDRVRHSRQPLPEEHEARPLAADLQRLRELRDGEHREQNRRRRQQSAALALRHRVHPSCMPFGTTTTPPSLTVKRSRSAFKSYPISVPAGMWTLLSTITRRRRTCRPTST